MLICIFFILLSSVLFAQNSNEIKDFKADPLVNTLNLPNGFKYFVTDSSSQVLQIPSRGANYSKNFIFSTYSPHLESQLGENISEYPSYSFSFLRGKNSSKWLLNFDFENEYSKSDENGQVITINEYAYLYDDSSNSNQNGNFIQKDSQILTRLKLTKIFQESQGGVAYGIFANANLREFKNNSNSEMSFFSSDSNGTYFEIQRNEEENLFNEKFQNLKFAFGVEYSKSKKDWDFLTSLAYTNTQNETKLHIKSNFMGYDTTYYFQNSIPSDTVYTNLKYDDLFKSNSKNSPHTISSKTFFRKQMDLFEKGDNLFLGIDLAYSLSSDKIASVTADYLRIQETTGENLSTLDSLKFNDSYTKKDDSWKIVFKNGYVLPIQKDDVFILTGINSILEIAKFNSLPFQNYLSSNLKTYQESKSYEVTFSIPFYVNYSPVKWFSFYGGINYNFQYLFDKTETESFEDIYSYNNYPNSYIITDKTINKRTTFNSLTAFYLGMSLKHKLGLVSHVAFKGDFGEFSNWNISLGYLF